MSYISSIRRNNEVLVWERDAAGKRQVQRYPAPFYFYIEDDEGTDLSIFQKKLTRYDFDDYAEFASIRDELRKSHVRLYESDIYPEVKVLAEHYYEKPHPKLNVSLLDIEVDYNEAIGMAMPTNPYAPISAIAIHHIWLDKSKVFVVPPPGWDKSTFDESLRELSEIIICKNERELLLLFLAEIQDSDILSGWNSTFFDIPYLCKRIEERLGKAAARRMCFDLADPPKYREVQIFNNIQIAGELSGRVHLDYLELFKKYEMEKRESYKLESVADEELPHLPKISYEGSLAKLYREQFNTFVRYNIRDTEILKGFEKKFAYIALANAMCHISTSQFRDVVGTLKLSDYAVMNYCHYIEGGIRVPDFAMDGDDSGEKIKGAYVFQPQNGFHKWVACVDLKSLYPTSIRSINISPETLIGQFTSNTKAWKAIYERSNELLLIEYANGNLEERTAAEWREYLLSQKWAISGFGTVFDQTKQGIIPAILTSWFDQRKEYQSKKKKATEKEMIDFFDRLQYVYKIKLNSFYGALANQYFRFYDQRMGESTTGTGREILLHQARMVAKVLEGNYNVDFPLYETVDDAIEKGADPATALYGPVFKGEFQSKAVIYGDTDSCYFTIDATTVEEARKIANDVAVKINESFQTFMQEAFLCQPGFDDLMESNRELISDRSIFVEKKRYVLHLVDIEGKAVDKLKVMGLEMKKTTTPKTVQKFLTTTVEMILKGTQWSEIEEHIIAFRDKVIYEADIFDIGLPKGVNKVEEYTQQYEMYGDKARLAGGQAASIHYNECLKKFEDKASPMIMSGMKIKVFYLKGDHGKFHTIALPTDIDIIPEWFTMEYEPLVDRELQADKLVDANLQLMFKAIGKQVPTRQTVLINDLLGF